MDEINNITTYTPYEQQYMDTINNLKNTFLKKNADYGSSVKKNYDKFENYKRNEGLKYVFGRISEKFDRLENLIYGNHDNQVVDESIADTLLDMANYAILASISFNEHATKIQKKQSETKNTKTQKKQTETKDTLKTQRRQKEVKEVMDFLSASDKW